MKIARIAFVILVSAGVAWVTASFVDARHAETQAQPAKEAAFARVMRTKTIRCAYADFPPITIIDPNTKSISGIYRDIVEEIGHRLGLKIDWTEEVGYDNINAGFESGRYDLFCSTIWPTSNRATSATFSAPLYYSPVFAWVRANDNRFDGDPAKLNDPSHTVSLTYGDVTQVIVEKDFPLARHLAATGSADITQKMEDVVSGKSDATVTDLVAAGQFIKTNPGVLKNAAPDHPVRVFPNTIMMPFGEPGFKSAIDTVIGEMQADGTVAQIVKKYTGDAAPFYFVGKPYEAK